MSVVLNGCVLAVAHVFSEGGRGGRMGGKIFSPERYRVENGDVVRLYLALLSLLFANASVFGGL